MHWETQELGLPKLAPGRRWNLLIDTALEDSFIEGEHIMDDQHVVEVAPRSIRILNTVTSNKPVKRRPAKKKAAPVQTEAAPAPAEAASAKTESTTVKAEDAHAKKEAAPAKAETRSAARTAEAPEAKQNIEPAADGAPAQHKSKVLSNEKE
jgi:hypothetical protein